MNLTVPFHREQFLTVNESKILTTARQPENKVRPEVLSQLHAHGHAEDLYGIHENYELHFTDKSNHTRAKEHATFKSQAQQLRLLALQTLSELIK